MCGFENNLLFFSNKNEKSKFDAIRNFKMNFVQCCVFIIDKDLNISRGCEYIPFSQFTCFLLLPLLLAFLLSLFVMTTPNSTDFLAHEAIRLVRHVFTATSIILSIPTVIIVIMCMNRASRSYSGNIILIVVGDIPKLFFDFGSISERKKEREKLKKLS